MKRNNTVALVLCGGKSTRMGIDKGLIEYHGVPQRLFVYHYLSNLCSQVFLCCGKKQVKEIGPAYNILCDAPAYAGIGPMAALLTAAEKIPGKSFLTVACDYPLFFKQDAKVLLRTTHEMAAAYYRPSEECYEPLLAIYHPAIFQIMKRYFTAGNNSLQQLLNNCGAEKIIAANETCLTSANTPGGKIAAMKLIGSTSKTHI